MASHIWSLTTTFLVMSAKLILLLDAGGMRWTKIAPILIKIQVRKTQETGSMLKNSWFTCCPPVIKEACPKWKPVVKIVQVETSSQWWHKHDTTPSPSPTPPTLTAPHSSYACTALCATPGNPYRQNLHKGATVHPWSVKQTHLISLVEHTYQEKVGLHITWSGCI